MNPQSPAIIESQNAAAKAPRHHVPFGVNEMRLSPRQWLVTAAIVALFILATPRIWKKVERFDTGPDYRIPYQLSKDYWLYQRRLEQISAPNSIVMLGDSVVWGEYVLPGGTLSHFLNQEVAQPGRFVNCGVNGLFPLAMQGLVDSYGGTLRNRKVILHCNVLWMSSPKADLRGTKEENFNHSRLVPQFSPRIACYRADAAERLSVLVERHVGFSAWVGHLQNAYFEQRSIPNWTLQDDGGETPRRPNAWRNPLRQINRIVPSEPEEDTQRGPRSERHRAWNQGGASPMQFEWVDLNTSPQWLAFQRVVGLLRQRGNDVFVILGPFNEHMVAVEQQPTYRAMRQEIAAWLAQNRVGHIVPEALPSDLYADASHPLTDGYALLARRIGQHQNFQQWLAGK